MKASKKVNLAEDQIEDICMSIDENKCLPEYVRKSIANRIRTQLYNDLTKVCIYPEMYEQFKKEIVKQYYKSLAEGGLACGIQASTSLGERQTQTTLNTFHACGLSVKTVVVGVPRFSELLNATKSPKMINCLIYLNEEFKEILDIRKRIGNTFTDITFKKIVKNYELIKNEPLEEWHHLFCDIYKVDKTKLGWRLRFYIDLSIIYEYNVTMKLIAKAINDEYSDAIVLYTPDWKGIIDVFVEESCFSELKGLEEYSTSSCDKNEVDQSEIEELSFDDIEENEDDDDENDDESSDPVDVEKKKIKYQKTEFNLKGGKEDIIPSDVVKIIHMEDRILPSLYDIRICGIKNIKDIFFEKRKDEWVITTEGSNLYGLFSNPLVDKTKTICNDMWEIYNIFGIEAARQFLIEEYMDVVSSDGSFVNSSNVELLVDVMAYTGTIISISRYGQKKVGCGPMAKASFEESLENFLKAGVNGEKESTDGVSASIMLGKMPKTGTGVFDLLLNIPKIVNTRPYISNSKEIEEPHVQKNEKNSENTLTEFNPFFN
jgi:DNA-directed RNA polymerase II subunit RPB1